MILAHLGSGSSLAAVNAGRSIDTTMAFTPIGGVVMSTRSGDLDPGVVTYLARADKLTADQVEDLLSRRSGLLAISGESGDMRRLLERETSDPSCRLAVDVYVYGIVKAIGAFIAALHGLDLLVFSGGIGEHAAVVRARICEALAFVGLQLDPSRNDANAALISSSASSVAVRVIPTDEELVIGRAAFRLLNAE
jgi:acetate kinase